MKPALDVREISSGEVTVLALEGDITFGRGSAQLPQIVHKLIGESKINLLLDFDGVRFVDSSGIGVLVSISTLVDRAGGKLKLANVSDGVKDLLRLTNLTASFEVYDNRQQALASFQ